MSETLIDLIRHKKAQIAQLQKELDEARGELTDRGAASGQVPAVSRKTQEKAAPAIELSRDGREIVPTSGIGLTVAILREAGRPLKIQEILKRLEAGGHRTKKNTLVGGLSRYVKLKRIFYRPAPSTFGLLDQRRQ